MQIVRSSDTAVTYGKSGKNRRIGTRETQLTRAGLWVCWGGIGAEWDEVVTDAADR